MLLKLLWDFKKENPEWSKKEKDLLKNFDQDTYDPRARAAAAAFARALHGGSDDEEEHHDMECEVRGARRRPLLAASLGDFACACGCARARCVCVCSSLSVSLSLSLSLCLCLFLSSLSVFGGLCAEAFLLHLPGRRRPASLPLPNHAPDHERSGTD